MSLDPKNAIERYIENGFLSQLKRVFGVNPFFTLNPNYSDAYAKELGRGQSKGESFCAVRPTDFRQTEENTGFRQAALSGQGIRLKASKKISGEEAENFIIHPLKSDTSYEVAISVNEYTDARRLWSIWLNTALNAGLDFTLKYQGAEFHVSCELQKSLSPPEPGTIGSERTDYSLIVGEIIVHGYVMPISDPHRVKNTQSIVLETSDIEE
jgi:hypothetical protein